MSAPATKQEHSTKLQDLLCKFIDHFQEGNIFCKKSGYDHFTQFMRLETFLAIHPIIVAALVNVFTSLLSDSYFT